MSAATRAAARKSSAARARRRAAALYGVLRRKQRERFYISFKCKGSWNPVTKCYTRYAWPILFRTVEEAWLAIEALPVFANREAIPGRGRIVSVTVERVRRPVEPR